MVLEWKCSYASHNHASNELPSGSAFLEFSSHNINIFLTVFTEMRWYFFLSGWLLEGHKRSSELKLVHFIGVHHVVRPNWKNQGLHDFLMYITSNQAAEARWLPSYSLSRGLVLCNIAHEDLTLEKLIIILHYIAWVISFQLDSDDEWSEILDCIA